MKVLVVEDDPSVRETLGMVLDAYHHHADLVENGEKAIEFLAKEWPDVLLLDLTLPGMSGEEVYEEIQARFGKIPPTVVLSAAQEGSDRAQALQGAYFLAKPYPIEQLSDVLYEVAGARGAA